MEIRTTDYHTAGEPFRIVQEGVPQIPGATVRARREYAAATDEVDRVRRMLCHEPRGHADMYGCFLVPPDDDARHVPHARLHAALAVDFGPTDAIEPVYVRIPDAEASLA